jgi:hypothetical protein
VLKRLSSRLPALFFIAALAFQATWYGMLWVSQWTRPGLLETADFSALYIAGQIAASGRNDLLYDLETQRQAQAELLDRPLQPTELLPFNHLPFLVPIQALLARLDYPIAYLVWTGLMACFLALAACSMGRLFHLSPILLISSLLFYPAFISLLKGQDSAVLLFGAALWFCGAAGGQDRLAGLGLALALIRPQIALALAIPFLFHRRKVFGWFCAGAAALGLAGLAMVGPGGARDFLHILLISAGGQDYGLNQAAMFNFTGLAVRMFPQLDPAVIRWAAWGLFAAGVVGLAVVWKLSPSLRLRHLGLAVLTSLFVAPHLHYHDLALLLLPLLAFAVILVEAGRLRPATGAYLPVAFSLLLLLGDISPARFVVPYIVMAVLIAGYCLRKNCY